jgi:hypothetical protein
MLISSDGIGSVDADLWTARRTKCYLRQRHASQSEATTTIRNLVAAI